MSEEQRESERQYAHIEAAGRKLREMEEHFGRRFSFHVTTFGCQMNERDSEKLRGILCAVGYTESADEDADFVVYNTCTVRENANSRVYGRLGYLHACKKKNPHMIIALCGCMMQEEEEVAKIRERYGFVDLIFGTHNLFKFAELIVRVLEEKSMVVDVWDEAGECVECLPNSRTYPFKSGVNIMYGCDNFCSYCIVPYVRGRERSRRAEDILREIKEFASDGVVEVMLLGQNVNSYGRGLPGGINFARLIREVEEVEGIERIRFMTPHPKDFSDELIESMRQSKKICPHIHLPLQSGSSRILKRMNRHYSKDDYLRLVDKIRAKLPDAALTSDIIVGFPGEEEEDFANTIDVVREAAFENAYTFIYSPRSGTPAARMCDTVPDDLIHERFMRLLEEIRTAGEERRERPVGSTLKILAESVNRQDETLITGRLPNNTLVHFPGDLSLIGHIIPVRIDECRGFYYMGSKAEMRDFI